MNVANSPRWLLIVKKKKKTDETCWFHRNDVTTSLEDSSGRAIIHTRASLPFLYRQACLGDEFHPCEARVCFAFNLSQCLSYHDNQGRVTICRWQTPFQQEALAFVVYTIGYSSAFNPIIPTGTTIIPIADVHPNTIVFSFFAQCTQRVYCKIRDDDENKIEVEWRASESAPYVVRRRVLRTISATKWFPDRLLFANECIEETQTDFLLSKYFVKIFRSTPGTVEYIIYCVIRYILMNIYRVIRCSFAFRSWTYNVLNVYTVFE